MVMIFFLCYQGPVSPVAGWEQTCPDMKTAMRAHRCAHTLSLSHPLFVSGQKYVHMFYWTPCTSVSEGLCGTLIWHQSRCLFTWADTTFCTHIAKACETHWSLDKWGLFLTRHSNVYRSRKKTFFRHFFLNKTVFQTLILNVFVKSYVGFDTIYSL